MGLTPGRFIPGCPTVNPEWVARLKRRQSAIAQLSKGLRAHLSRMSDAGVNDICEAIEFLLGAEIAEQLEQIAEMEKNPPQIGPFGGFRPSIDQFDQAQREVEQAERGIEAADAMIDNLPEPQAGFFREVQRPMLVNQLKSAQEWRSTIQRAMETPEPEPSAAALPVVSTPPEPRSKPKRSRLCEP